ncbi:unnamed protein product [Musa acuminata subsp. burmannicoides]
MEVASSPASSGVDLRVMKRPCLLTPTSGLGEGMSAGKRPAWARGSPHNPSVKASGGPPRAKPNPLVKIPLSLASSARDLDPAVVWDRDPVVRAFLRPLSDLAPKPPEEIVARPTPSSFLVVDVATFGIMAPSMELPTEEGPPRDLTHRTHLWVNEWRCFHETRLRPSL